MAIRYDGDGSVMRCGLQTVTCPVNTVGVMDAGLAKAMQLRIPGLLEFYRAACKSEALKVGTLLVYPIPKTQRQVLLFPTKVEWRNPSKLEWIETGLEVLVEQYEALGITELALPPLGCGCGELDYIQQVRPLFKRILEPCELPVELLVYKRGRP